MLQQLIDGLAIVLFAEELRQRLRHDLADPVDSIELTPRVTLNIGSGNHLLTEDIRGAVSSGQRT